jgi:hypothetical protein
LGFPMCRVPPQSCVVFNLTGIIVLPVATHNFRHKFNRTTQSHSLKAKPWQASAVDLDTDLCGDEGCNFFMQTYWFQVEHLSINKFIAVITTITGDELVKAEWLLLYWLVDYKGHRSTWPNQCLQFTRSNMRRLKRLGYASLPSDFLLKSQNGLISITPLALAQGVLATS